MANEHFNSELAAVLAPLQAQYEKSLATTENFRRAIEAVRMAYLNVGDSDAPPTHALTFDVVTTQESTSPRVVPPVVQNISWANRLKGLTQMQALFEIAESNGGIVKATEARDILIRAGLTKGKPKNVNSSITRLLIESDEFERVEPGTYRLKSMRPDNADEPVRRPDDADEQQAPIQDPPRQFFLAETVKNT